LKTVAFEQPSLDIVELVVVLAPIGGAVKPIAGVAFEIGDPGELELLEIRGLMERRLQIGIPAYGFRGSVLVDSRSLRID
jgi:hypothetical protein